MYVLLVESKGFFSIFSLFPGNSTINLNQKSIAKKTCSRKKERKSEETGGVYGERQEYCVGGNIVSQQKNHG